VSSSTTEDAATVDTENGTETTSRAFTLRPPLGPQSPIYSLEDFGRILNISDGPQELETAENVAEDYNKEVSEHATIANVSDNGSGSTVSDHALDDFCIAREAAATESQLAGELQDRPSDLLKDLPTVHLPQPPTAGALLTQHQLSSSSSANPGRGDLVLSVESETAMYFYDQTDDNHEESEVAVVLPPRSTKPPLAASYSQHNSDTFAAAVHAASAPRLSPSHPPTFPADFLCFLSFSCMPEPDEVDIYSVIDAHAYYYPPRGYLHPNLRSNVRAYVTEDMPRDVVEQRNKKLCVFGGVDALKDGYENPDQERMER
jgi:hypothetical protein